MALAVFLGAGFVACSLLAPGDAKYLSGWCTDGPDCVDGGAHEGGGQGKDADANADAVGPGSEGGSGVCSVPHTACDDFTNGITPPWTLLRAPVSSVQDGQLYMSANPYEEGPELHVSLDNPTHIKCSAKLRVDTVAQDRSVFVLILTGPGTDYYMGVYVSPDGSISVFQSTTSGSVQDPVSTFQVGTPNVIGLEASVLAGKMMLSFTKDGTSVPLTPRLQPGSFDGASLDLRVVVNVPNETGQWNVSFDDAVCDVLP
jgi:hypothetical protein